MTQIISTNTTWATGSTVNLTSNIQIAYGATLTIQSGVIVQGNGFTIETFGALDATGSAELPVQFQDAKFILGSNVNEPGSISIDHATITGGSFLAPTGNASYGAWSITNSTLTNIPAIYAWYPTGNVIVQYDTFQNDGGISIGTNGTVSVDISHNTFSGWGNNIFSDAAIENWASYGSSSTEVDNNNFLDVGQVALELPPGFTDAAMSASGNYFGTTNAATIASMIYDQNVDLNSAGVIPNLDVASSANVICFCTGTLIKTPSGDVQIEKLTAGDIVSTLCNGPRTVKWIGRGKVLSTRGQRTAATPVIMCKGALGDNVPHTDLRVTKAHGIYIDNLLIPAEFLVNHKTIIWDDRAQEVEIYHVELESHDVLIANGAPAESYRDDGNRWLFANANSGWGLPPQQPCASVLTSGKLLDAIWRRLLDRAGPRMTLPLTDDPDLHLVVDGKRLDPAKKDGDVYVFHLPVIPVSLHVVSRSAVPAELGFARDPRPLGIAVRRIIARQGSRFRTLDAHDTRLLAGFHAFESDADLRWTDGNATVPGDIFASFTGNLEFVLQVAMTGHYLDEGEVRHVA